MAIRTTTPKGYIWLNDEETCQILQTIAESLDGASDEQMNFLIQLVSKLCVLGNNFSQKDYDLLCKIAPEPPVLEYQEVDEVMPRDVRRMRQFGLGMDASGKASTSPNSNVALRRREWLQEAFADEPTFDAVMIAAAEKSQQKATQYQPHSGPKNDEVAVMREQNGLLRENLKDLTELRNYEKANWNTLIKIICDNQQVLHDLIIKQMQCLETKNRIGKGRVEHEKEQEDEYEEAP